MSEREFCLCFGEAVLASHSLSGPNAEVVTALETIKSGGISPQWAKFPRFQYCLQVNDGVDQKAKKKASTVSTKISLLEATSAEDVLEIVQGKIIVVDLE